MSSCGKEILLLISVAQYFIYSRAGSDCERLHHTLSTLAAKVAVLEDHVHHEAHDHHAALFSVSYSDGSSINTPGVHFIFDQVALNREEGYNSTTGIFTCPITGVYSFVYTSLPARGVETSIALMKNNVTVSFIYSDLPQNSTQFTERSDLIFLEEGDTLCVQLEQGAVLRDHAFLSWKGYRVSD
ncbi:cerebellin-3-like [Chiloscyllium punctatum]|uniref:C1q domain-containing protein n=1 Tax=Chiloscyllium punctatum TaxID=137246 RepID=A0A401T7A8_CHIPU|nr:hypothetical protein [Chiloscyllium punctatum]